MANTNKELLKTFEFLYEQTDNFLKRKVSLDGYSTFRKEYCIIVNRLKHDPGLKEDPFPVLPKYPSLSIRLLLITLVFFTLVQDYLYYLPLFALLAVICFALWKRLIIRERLRIIRSASTSLISKLNRKSSI